jgi:SAM-dependent methyltransferase
MAESSLSLRIKRLFYPGFNLVSHSRKRQVVPFFLREPAVRTLDVGCGNGYFTSRAARRGGTAIGFSFDPEQIERCNRFKPYMGVDPDRVEFRVSDVMTLDNMTEQFDQILLLDVIEHVDDDQLLMRQIARRLKPNGVVHLTTPHSPTGHQLGNLDRLATGGHCRLGYTMRRFESMVEAAGLDVAYARTFGGLGTYLTRPQFAMARALGGGLIAEGVAFTLALPLWWALEWFPINSDKRTSLYVIARKPGFASGA